MKNYMRTILNGIQNWVKKEINGIQKEIKDSVADWSQNDQMSSSYVKNRTHWEEFRYIVPEMTVFIFADNDWAELKHCPALIPGQKYTVTLNGVAYECVARPYNDNAALLGNGSIYGDGYVGNGEPFSIDSYSDGAIYLNAAVAGTHTISICHWDVHKLDSKYLDLPANLITTNDLSAYVDKKLIQTQTLQAGENPWDNPNSPNLRDYNFYILEHDGNSYFVQTNDNNLPINDLSSYPFEWASTDDGDAIIPKDDSQAFTYNLYGVKNSPSVASVFVINSNSINEYEDLIRAIYDAKAAGKVVIYQNGDQVYSLSHVELEPSYYASFFRVENNYIDTVLISGGEITIQSVNINDYVDEAIANLVNAAPATLDTLGELATALQNNSDVISSLNNAITNKADRNEIPSLSGLATEEYVNARIPAWSSSEEGAILQVVDGIPKWVLFVDAEEVSF